MFVCIHIYDLYSVVLYLWNLFNMGRAIVLFHFTAIKWNSVFCQINWKSGITIQFGLIWQDPESLFVSLLSSSVLVNDKQTLPSSPPPLPLNKKRIFSCPKFFLGRRNVLKWTKNQFLWFLFFELLLILFTIFKCFQPTQKNYSLVTSQYAQHSRSDFYIREFFLSDSYFLRYGRFCIQQWLTVNWNRFLRKMPLPLTSEAMVLNTKTCGVQW